MNYYDLSDLSYSHRADVINSSLTIYNPRYSQIHTLGGADHIVSDVALTGDFGFTALLEIQALNAGEIQASLEFLSQIHVRAKGIDNNGYIQTGRGKDIVKGEASAVISAHTVTVAQALAEVEVLDTSVISDIFSALDVLAIADGIDNSGGKLQTGKGSDKIIGISEGNIAATAIAIVDSAAIVDAVLEMPYTDGLAAFASAMATSLTDATIIATGINNISGVITTNKGGDQIDAFAQSDSSTFASTTSTTFASASPETQAIALTLAEAAATAIDVAIAIDNEKGFIGTGKGGDVINATAYGVYEAIAIYNEGGLIATGKGADQIITHEVANQAFGIIGGIIDLGRGHDLLLTSLLSGDVQVRAGAGNDQIQAFGDGTIDGGTGQDTLNLDGYDKDDFEITLGANQDLAFRLDDLTLNVMNVEQFIFADNVVYDSIQALTA